MEYREVIGVLYKPTGQNQAQHSGTLERKPTFESDMKFNFFLQTSSGGV